MKSKKVLIMLLLAIILIILLQTISNAAVQIVEPNANIKVWQGVTANDAFNACRGMSDGNSTLGNGDIEAHLSLNSDWAIVSYLAISNYGGTENSSTTGNKSGVIDYGKNYSITSAICSNCTSSAEGVGTLYSNKDTKFVECITGNEKGLGLNESNAWAEKMYFKNESSKPVILRIGRCGFYFSEYRASSGHSICTSTTTSWTKNATFRPVLWNK